MTLIDDYGDLDEVERRKLEHALSVFDKNIFSVTFKAYRIFTSKKTGKECIVIPRSYPMKWLQQKFPEEEVVYSDNRYKNDCICENIECLYEPRDKRQKSALKWLNEKYNWSQKILSLKPGDGKTYIALKYICDEKRKAFIIVHNHTILQQWKERIVELTNIKEDRIALISGSDKFYKIMDECEKYDIYVAIHRTLFNVLKESEKALENFRKKSGAAIKIIDEAHIEFASITTIDLASHFSDNLYLTATPERTDYQENKLYNLILPTYWAFTLGNNKESISESDKYHSCYFINYDSRCSYADVQEMVTKYGFSFSKWAEWTIENNVIQLMTKMFVYYYEKAVTKAESMGFKKDELFCAVLFSTLEQCELFEKEIISLGFKADNIGQFNSLVKKKDKQSQINKKIIISTEKSFGQAVDTRLDIMMDFIPYSSSGQCWQIVGRLRKDFAGIYYSFHDVSNYKHKDSKEVKIRELKKRVKTIIELNYRG